MDAFAAMLITGMQRATLDATIAIASAVIQMDADRVKWDLGAASRNAEFECQTDLYRRRTGLA